MNSISVTYVLYWELKNFQEYQFTKAGKCFNLKSGNEIKKVMKSRCIGYNIRGKFIALNTLRNQLVKIKINETPF